MKLITDIEGHVHRELRKFDDLLNDDPDSIKVKERRASKRETIETNLKLLQALAAIEAAEATRDIYRILRNHLAGHKPARSEPPITKPADPTVPPVRSPR